jgi:hypothetical protein
MSQPGSARQVRPPCAAGAPNGSPPVFDKLVEEAIAGYDKIIALILTVKLVKWAKRWTD